MSGKEGTNALVDNGQQQLPARSKSEGQQIDHNSVSKATRWMRARDAGCCAGM
jgi:hypothetical protein